MVCFLDLLDWQQVKINHEFTYNSLRNHVTLIRVRFTGALIGGLTAASTCSNFRPIAEILLHDLSTAQQAMLVNRVRNVIRDIGPEDVITLTAVIASGGALRENLLNALKLFVTSDLHYTLAS